jgi:NADH:ubiquinone oxidoreductase subunit E
MNHLVHPHHPDITDDMWDRVDTIIKRYQGRPGAIIAVLRECQEVVGYLPNALMDHISRGLNLPSSSVFGVATFYSFFSLTPKGRHFIKVCMGTACYVKGIKETMERIQEAYKIKEGGTTEDRRFTMEAVRCIGACGLAPVMVVNDDVHGAIASEEVIDVLEKYE